MPTSSPQIVQKRSLAVTPCPREHADACPPCGVSTSVSGLADECGTCGSPPPGAIANQPVAGRWPATDRRCVRARCARCPPFDEYRTPDGVANRSGSGRLGSVHLPSHEQCRARRGPIRGQLHRRKGCTVVIIWGIRSVRRNMGVVLAMCHRCGQPCAQSIFMIRRWFTLFFIPLFPVGTSHLGICSMCATATRLTSETAHHLQREGERQRSVPVENVPDGHLSPIGGAIPARAELTSPASGGSFCGTCGSSTEPSDAFCQDCGTARPVVGHGPA
jgi:hypothetical protein